MIPLLLLGLITKKLVQHKFLSFPVAIAVGLILMTFLSVMISIWLPFKVRCSSLKQEDYQ